jgi:hypothetical protein
MHISTPEETSHFLGYRSRLLFGGARDLLFWRRQVGGLDVSETKHPRALAHKNAALKRLMGKCILDNQMLKDMLGQK